VPPSLKVQIGDWYLRARVKSFSQTRSPIACATGNNRVVGLDQRRSARQRNA
jgi:hypothetical protein